MAVNTTLRVEIDEPSAVYEVRRVAKRLARSLGFASVRQEQITVCASELAANVVTHTRGGVMYLQAAPGTDAPDLELLAVDDGPGVESFERCLVDGYTTVPGSLGTGLGAVRRMATRFAAYSLPSWGTVVFARFRPGPELSAPPRLSTEVGALCVAAKGQTVSGDAYRVLEDDNTLALLMVDGLGHGAEAARASLRALPALVRTADAYPPDLLAAVHRRLLGTRGAAGAAVRIDRRRGRGEFCGVGNLTGVVLSGESHQLSSRPGTLGLKLPFPYCEAFPLPRYAMVLMHTDGIRQQWNLARYPRLLAQPPIIIAAVLVHDYWRPRDDAAVVVMRPSLGSPRVETSTESAGRA